MTQILAYAAGIIILIVGIAVSVALHELGHMIPAKRFGVKVPEYFIGFGPRIWSFKRGETEYGVKAVWLGGYVKLVGMLPPARPDRPDKRDKNGELGMVGQARAEALAEIEPGEEHRAFYRLSVPKKLVVMAGGILTNLVLGIVLIAVALGVVGVYKPTSTVAVVAPCVSSQSDGQCADSDPVSPAAQAGLRPGDTIVSWDGAPVSDWEDVQAAIASAGTDSATVLIEREGRRQTLTVTAVEVERPVRDDTGRPVTDASGKPVTAPRPFAGLSPVWDTQRLAPAELPAVVGQSVWGTLKAIATLPVGLYKAVAAGLGYQERDAEGVVSLVGIGRVAGEVSSSGAGEGTIPLSMRVSSMLTLLGALNLALFAFNLVPLLPLDGGHVAGACWEALRRALARAAGRPDPGPVDTARMLPLTQVVVGLLIVMALILVWVDLVAPI
ncbi:RIP metalloprotease [Actinomyces slackii]|uniref:Zinc metalloprotease SA1105 n=1 Tax=Actinomyces slackii TaxID=52774 RepID=A0A3S4U3G3_9ACTO|nr:site-2 protease family protein [Actinomyces slackii]VEG75592.1 Putative zinc metalloprotease SA1105 [Actinomyces slackii]